MKLRSVAILDLVKDEDGNLLADSHIILNRWKNYFYQLLNVHGVNDVRQTEMHTAELLVHEHSSRMKFSGTDQILSQLIQAGGNTSHSEIHELINSIWNKKELLWQWMESIIVPVYKKSDKTACTNYRGILLPTTYKILSNILVSRLTPYMEFKLLRVTTGVDFDVIDKLLVTYYVFIRYWRKNGSIMGQYISYL